MAFDFQGLMNNPMFQMGMGLLNAGYTPGGTIGSGLQQGLLNVNQNQQRQQQNDYRNLLMDKTRLEMAKMMQPEVQKPTGSMQNYEYLISQGVPAEQARVMAFGKGGTTVNVGGNPIKPPENYMWETPGNPAASGFSVRPITGGPADPNQATSADSMKKYKEGQAKLGQVRQSLTNYMGKLKQHGGEVLPTQGKYELASSYRDLQLELKELYNLGVLNGPDLMLMEQVLSDPTSISGATMQGVSSLFGGDPLGKQLGIIMEKLDAAELRNKELYGGGKPSWATEENRVK